MPASLPERKPWAAALCRKTLLDGHVVKGSWFGSWYLNGARCAVGFCFVTIFDVDDIGEIDHSEWLFWIIARYLELLSFEPFLGS